MTTRFLSTLRKSAIAFVLAMFCVGAYAQMNFLKQMMDSINTLSPQQMREQFNTDPPKNTIVPDIAHWLKLRLMAKAIGDTASSVMIDERAIKSDPDNMQYQAWLAEDLLDNNQAETALPIMRAAVAKQRNRSGHERVRHDAELALNLISVGHFDEAKKILIEDETWESITQWRIGVNARFWPNYASAKYNQAYCKLFAATNQYQQAIAACEKEYASWQAGEPFLGLVDATLQDVMRGAVLYGKITSQMRIAILLAQDGQHFRAEQIMNGLRAQVQSASKTQLAGVSIGRSHFADAFSAHAEIRLLQNRLTEAAKYAATAKEESVAAERGFLGAKTKSAIETKLKIAMLRGQWQEMREDFALLDRLVKDDPVRAPQVELALLRGTWLANDSTTGDQATNIARAQELLKKYQGRLQSSLGERHFLVSLSEGLRLSYDSKLAGKSLDVARLAVVCQTLLDPDLAGANLAQQTLYKPLLQSVFEALLNNLEGSTDAATQAIAFEVADGLRANNVQKSVQAAALRMSFTDTALAKTVRELQDADLTLQTMAGRVASLIASGVDSSDVAFQTLREQIQQVEQKKKTLSEALGKQNAQYAQLTKFKPASVARVASKLAADEVFVASYPLKESMATWLVMPSGEVKFHKGSLGEAQIKTLIGSIRKSLDVASEDAAKMPAFQKDAAQTLYRESFAPLLAQYAKPEQVNHVVLSVAGALTQIPLSVLQTGDAVKPWLIQQYGVSQITSASSWLALREAKRQSAPEPMMAWGDPLFALVSSSDKGMTRQINKTVRATVAAPSSEERSARAFKYDQIPALPETRDEIQAIAKVLGKADEKNLYFGAAAHRQSVLDAQTSGMLPKANVIAFATHGLMAGDLPGLTQPALALAQRSADKDNPIAPLLLLSDILTLQTNAQWVVLSACNTAASDGTGEEAISGLARGFFYAGAKSVLATHWAVESSSAALLTTHTFEHQAKNPNSSRAQSLRHAMLQVMSHKDYAHPTYWAPYALFGDGGR